MADALGYKVGWDAGQKAVIIDDVDAILADNQATYQRMDEYMAYAKTLTRRSPAAIMPCWTWTLRTRTSAP